MGASQLLGVTSALRHPPPLINTSCGASRHARVPAALTVTSPSYRICDGPPTPPPPGLALAPRMCYPDCWPGLVAWSFGSGLRPPALLFGPRGLDLGLYLPRLGCLGVPWCACGLLPYIPSLPSPFYIMNPLLPCSTLRHFPPSQLPFLSLPLPLFFGM